MYSPYGGTWWLMYNGTFAKSPMGHFTNDVHKL